MGLFDSIAKGFQNLTGGVDTELIATGILARGEILSISLSGTTVQIMNNLVERTCTFVLNVIGDLAIRRLQKRLTAA